MLVKEKPDSRIRICIDPSQTINKAIKRPIYTIPTIEEKLPLLTNAKVFTTVDVFEVLHTIELDKDSSFLTFQGSKLQQYTFTVQYKKSKEMYIADTLSRASLPEPTAAGAQDWESFVLNLQR